MLNCYVIAAISPFAHIRIKIFTWPCSLNILNIQIRQYAAFLGMNSQIRQYAAFLRTNRQIHQYAAFLGTNRQIRQCEAFLGTNRQILQCEAFLGTNRQIRHCETFLGRNRQIMAKLPQAHFLVYFIICLSCNHFDPTPLQTSKHAL